MPSSDYATVARGALKLKGGVPNAAGVPKKKKKKSKSSSTTDLEKNLSTGESKSPAAPSPPPPETEPADTTTTATTKQQEFNDDDDNDDLKNKTEAERRFAEVKRKRLKDLASNDPAASRGGVRPELLKTHKQRVEELNSHLSRLSEHHDMPKIGPG
ncbi:hypothetical protein QBC44DRAFT_315115 [Cladorrhinum sp. PSN332]|nr:hypothetical protein QBC44DRAFT_315115 [Cladorrhinum sp. PSN332]